MNKKILFIPILACSISLFGCVDERETQPETVFATFVDYDDSVLYHTKVPYGSMVTYEGPEPFREPSVDKVYTFQDWNQDIYYPLFDNTIFRATYSYEPRQYLVSFYNYDDSLLWTTNVAYGTYANYPYGNPTKPSNDEHIEYVFNGWDRKLNNTLITGDTSFKATFRTNYYVFATFNNYNGELLYREKVSKGGTAVYRGQTPTRTYDGQDKVYRFSGWDSALSNLNEDKTFTAQFSLLNIYTVTFKNYNGNVLQEAKVVHGDDAVYTGPTPTKPSTTSGDYTYTYTFSGWSSSIKNIQSDKTVTAQFSSSSYNHAYADLISEIKSDLRSQGAVSGGMYTYTFNISTSGSYIYTGNLQMSGNYGQLSILMTSSKSDSSGSRATAVRIYLPDNWASGNFSFAYQFVVKDSDGYTKEDDNGSGSIYGPGFSSSSSISFGSYYGSMAQNAAATNCASMLSIALDKFARSSTYNMKTLGFNNYNY